MSTIRLAWSRKGEVACQDHTPAADSERWTVEGWREMSAGELARAAYRCQHCSGTPFARQTKQKSSPLVLNVDDRPANLYLRDRILREHGFIVANADTVRKAIEAARQLRPQLILLDVHLPDGDGRELCQKMKSDPEFRSIPIVLISASLGGHAAQLESVRWGEADGFIHEPVEPTALASTLWRVLSDVA